MEKNVIILKRLLLLCIFVFMMGFMLIPQTANADADQTIYWGYTDKTLTLSDRPVSGTKSGSFSAGTRFTDPYYETYNPQPVAWVKAGVSTYYIDSVVIEGNLQPVYTDYWFAGCEKLESIDLRALDLSECKSMKGMFAECGHSASKFSVKFSEDVDTSKCENMDNLFALCDKGFDPLASPNENFYALDTDSCKSMYRMFYYCQMMKEIDLTKFDLSNCTNTSNMFENCSNLASVNMDNLDLSKLLVKHPITWSKHDSFCKDQYCEHQPVEVPSVPVKVALQQSEPKKYISGFSKFHFDVEESDENA